MRHWKRLLVGFWLELGGYFQTSPGFTPNCRHANFQNSTFENVQKIISHFPPGIKHTLLEKKLEFDDFLLKPAFTLGFSQRARGFEYFESCWTSQMTKNYEPPMSMSGWSAEAKMPGSQPKQPVSPCLETPAWSRTWFSLKHQLGGVVCGHHFFFWPDSVSPLPIIFWAKHDAIFGQPVIKLYPARIPILLKIVHHQDQRHAVLSLGLVKIRAIPKCSDPFFSSKSLNQFLAHVFYPLGDLLYSNTKWLSFWGAQPQALLAPRLLRIQYLAQDFFGDSNARFGRLWFISYHNIHVDMNPCTYCMNIMY